MLNFKGKIFPTDVFQVCIYRQAAYAGMDATLMARMKEREDDNRRLKTMYAEERLKAKIVAEALTKKWKRHLSGERSPSGRWRIGRTRWFGMPGIWHQPDLFSVQGKGGRGKPSRRRLAGPADE